MASHLVPPQPWRRRGRAVPCDIQLTLVLASLTREPRFTPEHDQPTSAQLRRGGRPPLPETRNLVLLDRSLKLVSQFPHQSVMRLVTCTYYHVRRVGGRGGCVPRGHLCRTVQEFSA